MKYIFTYILIIFLIGCKKPDEIYGNLTITGRISDFVSGAPIANSEVYLYNKNYNPYGNNLYRAEVLTSALTNNDGFYIISFEATGQLGFELEANPSSPYYVSSDYADGYISEIRKSGIHRINIHCARSAYAQISIIDEPPEDTLTLMNIFAQDSIFMYPFNNNDTIVYLKLIGYNIWTNKITFQTNRFTEQLSVHAGPWDTIPVMFKY
jgi:hypothetical protein